MCKSILFFLSTLISLITFSQGDNLRLYFQEKHPNYEFYKDVWGWDDTINDKQYAIMGATGAFLIYDITDLNNINLVIEINDDLYNLDLKVYQNYLFNNTGYVYNLSNLPNSIEYEYTWGYFSHNIWMKNHFLYDDKYRKYDLTNPLNPQVDEIVSGQGCHDGLVHDSLLITFRDTYLNFSIHNLNDSINPNIIDVPYDSSIIKYSHSGIVYEKEKLLYISDERSTKIAIYDISTPNNPQFLNHFDYNNCSTPHNFWIKGDTLYMSYYSAGVIVFNLTNTPLNPQVIGYFDTYYGCKTDLVGAFGIYVFEKHNKILVSDTKNGLFVFSFDEDAIYSEPFLNMDNKLENGIKIYPNPFSEQITVQLPQSISNLSTTEIKLFDVLGNNIQILQQVKKNAIILDGSELQKGVYILDINGIKQKIVKE